MPEKDEREKTNKKSKWLWLLLLLSLVSVVLAAIFLGFVMWFWIILIVWLVIWLLYFLSRVFMVAMYFWLIFVIWMIFSLLLTFGVILGSKDGSASSGNSGGQSSNGVKLADCTSTAADQPVMLEGWKATIYSAPLLSSSPDPDKANSVRTFSYKGIKDKVEANSMYTRIEKSDGGMITGYDTTMEVCDSNNKASMYYTTAYTNQAAGENVTARVHYFHGGTYLFGAGTYRVDAYIRDTSGKWHLVNRLSGINVTE